MKALETICRVRVHAAGTLEAVLPKHFPAMGSTGYAVMPRRGKGEHDTVDDTFATVTRVRIELPVQPEVAREILAYGDSPGLKGHPVAARMEAVQVVEGERY